MKDVTRFLNALTAGDRTAFDQLVAAVYPDLTVIAAALMRNQRKGHPFEPLDLVHEAYLKLVRYQDVRWRDQAHFFGSITQTMRRLLIDHARAASALKRNGTHVPLEALADILGDRSAEQSSEWVDLLARLARKHPRWSQVVECRCSFGFTIQETADALGVSHCTVSTDWQNARKWLQRDLDSATEGIRPPRAHRTPPLPTSATAVAAP